MNFFKKSFRTISESSTRKINNNLSTSTVEVGADDMNMKNVAADESNSICESECSSLASQSSSPTTVSINTLMEERDVTTSTTNTSTHIHPNINPNIKTNTALKVLFLSSDTGGGHRASAEALGSQFERLYPGSTYHLLDIVKQHSLPPYNNLESWYKHLSAHPTQWNLVYKISNSHTINSLINIHLKLTTEQSVRQSIQSYEADVVISVHPLMTNIPVTSCAKISAETGKHLPMFTVVTDLGSGHCTWFDNGVEKMFIASDQIRDLAMTRGNVPSNKLVRTGLPIRYDFSLEAQRLGDRTTMEGKIYQLQMKNRLNIINVSSNNNDHHHDHHRQDRKVLLVMGGGEGVGSLSEIVNCLYYTCTMQKHCQVMILVVCGRNEVLKSSLENRDWEQVMNQYQTNENRHQHQQQQQQKQQQHQKELSSSSSLKQQQKQMQNENNQQQQECHHHQLDEKDNENIATKVTGIVLNPIKAALQKSMSIASNNNINDNSNTNTTVAQEKYESDLSSPSSSSSQPKQLNHVIVQPLGFIPNMAEYMVAADVLITKAGPGTIAEAASLGLPILLTSFLPGQEEGNVDFVEEKQFGIYKSDSNPMEIANTACEWLQDPDELYKMSLKAKEAGTPNAAENIVKCIGKSVLRWKEHEEEE